MWTSIPVTLITLLLLSTETEAHKNRFHLKHGEKVESGRNSGQRGRGGANKTVVVTVTVKPMPIGTYDGIIYPGTSNFPTATDVASGIFPPGAGGSGTGTIGTGTGIVSPTGTSSFPVFTGTPIIPVPSGTDEVPSIAPTSSSEGSSVIGSFPAFTRSPIISIPSGTRRTTAALTSAGEGASNTLPSVSFPAFTRSSVIDVPGSTDTPDTARTTGPESSSKPSLKYPPFTGTPIINIPSGTDKASATPPSATTPALKASSSSAGSLTFPVFTGTPVINIPAAASVKSIAETPSPTPSSTDPTNSFLRGVNLGGWLILEKWMTEYLFTGAFENAKDQYTFDSTSGSLEALEQHWSHFFVEDDIANLAEAGFNALRIPIGYWAYDNTGTPYHKGADTYLEQAIEWARKNSMKVLVDLHGSPGSQNGFDNSGQAGEAHWQEGDNLDKSIEVLKVMAKKYGAQNYADVVLGLQMVNEPISWGNNDFSVTKSWSEKAYAAVKAEAENSNLMIVMHDAFQGGVAWESVSTALRTTSVASAGNNPFTVDEHLYQLFTDEHNSLNQDQHIAAACAWSSSLAASSSSQKTIVGEFSAATNICLLADGTTIPGTSCTEQGCECQSGDWTSWSQGMKDQMRKYVEAQLDAFEVSSAGYFAWSAKAPGGWGVLNMLSNGVWPATATERKFPNQCGGTKRDVMPRSMRRGLRR